VTPLRSVSDDLGGDDLGGGQNRHHIRAQRETPPDSIKTTNPHTLDSDTTHSQILDEHSQVQVETRTHTLVQTAHSLTYVYIGLA